MAAAESAPHRIFPGSMCNKSFIKRGMLRARSNREDLGDSNMEVFVQCDHRCQARGGKFELYFNISAKDKAQLLGLTYH
eukprot:snap_masked-scaffold_77-processed-gene-0.47-mRNA-1 protein AED:1.00 eAED:1.00 QI:0/-1/0/0/-1/1/1/0/78